MYYPPLHLFTCTIASTGRLLWRLTLTLALVFFAVTPNARAVIPAPGGGYPGDNTAEGENALFSLTNGQDNTAIGFRALYSNTTGSGNTATGSFALFDNTTGNQNTANGGAALTNNTSGHDNTANGAGALLSNGTGDNNTANGVHALAGNTTGNANTATGVYALVNNQGGGGNTANGYWALFSNISGSFNMANGYQALFNNITGFWNTANGYRALYNNEGGSFNIAVGVNAGFAITGSSNIDIGNTGVGGESGKIRIGTKGTHNGTFIAGISGVAVSGTQVVVNANGKLGVAGSSARFKEAIKAMDKASEGILALKPVTFRYKRELDPDAIPQFGLVAEQVEKVNPDLVVRGEDGKVMTVRYDAVNAMLLNEFLKEHRKVQELEKQVAVLTAGLRRVTAQVESGNPARIAASQK
jgi:hypothetical protein